MKLTELEGIGEAIAARIVKEFGSEEAFFQAAKNLEVDRLAAVDGISEKKAVEIVLKVNGLATTDFLRTPRAEALYEDILDRIREFANTSYARNRVSLLVPLQDKAAIEANLKFALKARDKVEKLPRARLAQLLSRVAKPRVPRPKYDSSVAVLVDTEADYERLVKIGLDKHCRILTPEDGGFNDGFEVIIYAYSTGTLDLTGVENVVSIPFTADKGALVPEATLQYFQENRPLWETAVEVAGILGTKSILPQVLETLDRLQTREVDFAPVEKLVREVADEMNRAIKEKTSTVQLTGDDVVAMMSGQTPKKIQQIQVEVLRTGRERIMRETGDDFSVFEDGFPVKVNDEMLEERKRTYLGRRKRTLFREKVDAARKLHTLRDQAEQEIQRLLEFDYEFALGSFAIEYKLNPPKFGKGFKLKGTLHLNLLRQGGSPIEYELGKPHNVVLLTGANSGGKTTLLETVSQVALLAHLGLPVNAEEATVELVEALYFFTQKRSLDAGAFESFLRGFIPIVTSKTRKLVLADELEAMTELEAASKIVGTFIEMLKESGSCGICVTHMAEEVSKYTSVRIDGIEARGLDEEFNLIVDRTPRMNYRARSTPELILQRLQKRATGEEAKVYEAILKKFENNLQKG
ncbi:MAG TPA: helix-hairpin-helix domain-containing protein [Candidatus Thermoplasmatota archaeon]|nr:helix-hairpin-helix domain-containing protein [Candidatus Thermoplasmatota archaeon]